MHLFHLKLSFLLFPLLFSKAQSLYEDQAGLYDWRIQNFGFLQDIVLQQSSSLGRRAVVSSEQNVIASLNFKNGQIAWRRTMETEFAKKSIEKILDIHGESVVVIVGNRVFSWQSQSGQLNWEIVLLNKEKQLINGYYVEEDKLVLLVDGERIYGIQIQNGAVRYRKELNEGVVDCSLHSGILHVTTEKEYRKFTVGDGGALDATPLPSTRCYLSKSAQIACLESDGVRLLTRHLPLSDIDSMHSLRCGALFLLETEASGNWVLDAAAATIVEAGRSLVVGVEIEENCVPLKLVEKDGAVEVRPVGGLSSALPDARYRLPKDAGRVAMFVPVITRNTIPLLIVWTDAKQLLVLNTDGAVLWRRDEALAEITAAEVFDPPPKEDIEAEEALLSGPQGLFSSMMLRASSQLHMLVELLDVERLLRVETGRPALHRDRFGLRKVILVAARPNILMALDSADGSVIWRQQVADAAPMSEDGSLHLWMLRSASHQRLTPVAALLAATKGNAKKSVVVLFNPLDGTELDRHILEQGALQAILAPIANSHHLRPLVVLDNNRGVHVFPLLEYSHVLSSANRLFVLAGQRETAVLSGYRLRNDAGTLKGELTWQAALGNDMQGSKLLSLVTIPANDIAYSQGRVLGDRSVLYKYLNPHLVAACVDTADGLTVSLLDAVTGEMLYSTGHKRARPPCHLTVSENSFVYSFWNDRFRRTELVTVEMYMFTRNGSDVNAWSWPRPSAIERQAYIWPDVIASMAFTTTHRGITYKDLMIATQAGLLVEIPRAFIDARRPLNPQPIHREEGLLPYAPELPLPYDMVVNYHNYIERTTHIYCTPAGLESVALVFATGLDLFFTRAYPSKMFDMLKEDFDPKMIAAVLSAFLIITVVTKRLAAEKLLKRAWK